ncbi:MAG: xanthine dehydrogenase accessory protein XdhC [Thiolinea sp.]
MSWLHKLAELAGRNEPVILLTVLETKGSVPREVSTKMLVTATDTFGTIGGGNLEFQCIAQARERLATNDPAAWLRTTQRFALGASLGQCCGGVVVMLMEYIDRRNGQWIHSLNSLIREHSKLILMTPLSDETEKFLPNAKMAQGLLNPQANYFVETIMSSGLNILLFGAGHVGQALVKVLADIDCSVTWIDSRAEQFPAEIPLNTRRIISDYPEDEVSAAPAASCFLVMTHSHQLDYQLCEQILQRADFRYCGLIGSQTKRRKFEQRMQAKGMPAECLEQLTCPVGIAGISGKEPAVIAIAVAAQLLSLTDA